MRNRRRARESLLILLGLFAVVKKDSHGRKSSGVLESDRIGNRQSRLSSRADHQQAQRRNSHDTLFLRFDDLLVPPTTQPEKAH